MCTNHGEDRINAKFINFKVKDMVGLVDLRFAIRLERLLLANAHMTKDEPEIFLGLISRVSKPKRVMLVFMNVKISVTGMKSRRKKYAAFNHVYPKAN